VHSVLVGKTNGRNYLEALGIDWSTILKWILKRWDDMDWTDLPQDRENGKGKSVPLQAWSSPEGSRS